MQKKKATTNKKMLTKLTKEEYICSNGDRIPVGTYQVDSPIFSGATFKPLNETWEVSVPFAPNRELTLAEKKRYPVVLRQRMKNVIAFEHLDLERFESVVAKYISGEYDEVIEDVNYTNSRKIFVKKEGNWIKTSINLQFMDGFKSWTMYSPWCYSHPIDGSEFIPSPEEEKSAVRKALGLFHDGSNPKDSRVFRVKRMGEKRVALQCYTKDPCLNPYASPKTFRDQGWYLLPKEQVGENIAVVYNCSKGKMVHIVAWQLCNTSFSNTFKPKGIVKDVYSNDFWLYREQLLSKLRKELI